MAKTIKSFKLADATLRQLSWLAANGWNGNQTAVVETAIDRMYREETMNTGAIRTIEWHVNLPDLLDDEEEANVEASQRRYVEMVESALQEAYPGAEIITHTHQATGWCQDVRVNGLAGTTEGAVVDDVIGSVYQGWEWLVTD